ncbi:hypothetical protein DXX93_14630 [Thalassotalea euphylliae]|uniref:Uncharacterized protein n=2 Tax=Thalassotalea euphylliae TaxID=1655234 RepID=A0A3E0TT66_9GAMM|nr:hypothetical protein DXX93_14630 [Thalassotalea euphylliae]
MITSLMLYGFYYTSVQIGSELFAFAMLATVLMTVALITLSKLTITGKNRASKSLALPDALREE